MDTLWKKVCKFNIRTSPYKVSLHIIYHVVFSAIPPRPGLGNAFIG